MGQREHWNRHRKIILQMISISSLFLVTNLPLCIVALIQLLGLTYFAINIMSYLFLLVYINPTIFPFISILSLPGLKQTFKCFAPRRNTRSNQIQPQANIVMGPREQLGKSGQWLTKSFSSSVFSVQTLNATSNGLNKSMKGTRSNRGWSVEWQKLRRRIMCLLWDLFKRK